MCRKPVDGCGSASYGFRLAGRLETDYRTSLEVLLHPGQGDGAFLNWERGIKIWSGM
jgi:hypothetical protein